MENNSMELVKTAFAALDEKKAEDIKVIDISQISVFADCFIIATGNNSSHLDALVDNVEKKMSEKKYYARQTEGRNSSWVLMDYNDVIVHIFSKEDREFYDLERIWKDGTIIESEMM